MSFWRAFDVPAAGYVNALSEAIAVTDARLGDLFCPVDRDLQIIASDYSGQHREATHEVYSFLVTTQPALEAWLPLRQAFRERWLPDGRRLSFKQLRESVRRRAYPHFLDLAGALPANLLTVMIDNRVGSFIAGGPNALADALDDCFVPGVSGGSIEKIYRLAVLVAMIQAGLSDLRQPAMWISDHDETLDTHDKRERFALLATYLVFGLTGGARTSELHFMTTLSQHLPAWGEDLAAIPDIVAGASANLSSVLPIFMGRPTWTVGVAHGEALDWRARTFADWLSAPHGVLRHVLLRLAPDANGQIRASAQRFNRQAIDLMCSPRP